MKPPVAYDQRPMLWVTGGIFTALGIILGVSEDPLVPLTHVFHLLPISIGGAIGSAILREKYGPRWVAAYIVLALWLFYAVVTNQTTIAPVFLASGLFSLTRALLKTVAEMES